MNTREKVETFIENVTCSERKKFLKEINLGNFSFKLSPVWIKLYNDFVHLLFYKTDYYDVIRFQSISDQCLIIITDYYLRKGRPDTISYELASKVIKLIDICMLKGYKFCIYDMEEFTKLLRESSIDKIMRYLLMNEFGG